MFRAEDGLCFERSAKNIHGFPVSPVVCATFACLSPFPCTPPSDGGSVWRASPSAPRAAGDLALARGPAGYIDPTILPPAGRRLDVRRARSPSPCSLSGAHARCTLVYGTASEIGAHRHVATQPHAGGRFWVHSRRDPDGRRRDPVASATLSTMFGSPLLAQDQSTESIVGYVIRRRTSGATGALV